MSGRNVCLVSCYLHLFEDSLSRKVAALMHGDVNAHKMPRQDAVSFSSFAFVFKAFLEGSGLKAVFYSVTAACAFSLSMLLTSNFCIIV